ncbi:hypothetical protein BKA93DRAFT_752227 [Sparassis latifolia]
MPPCTNSTPTKFHFRNRGCTAGRKSIKSDKMVADSDVEMDETSPSKQKRTAVKSTPKAVVPIPHNVKAKKMVDYSDEDTVTREKATTMPRKGGKDKKTIDNVDNSDLGSDSQLLNSSAKLKDVFMDNDSDVEQSLESDAALPINEPEIMETPKKKVNKAFVLLPTSISSSPNKGKVTHTPIKRVYISDSDKDAQPEQSSPVKKGRNRQTQVSNCLLISLNSIRLSPTKFASGSKGKTEDVLKAIMKDGKMEINNDYIHSTHLCALTYTVSRDTDEGEENFECQVTSITLMDPILLKADAYETLPRRAYYAIMYQPINTLTFTGVLDGFMGYQVNKPALIKVLTFAFSDGLFVNPAHANIKNYQMTGSLESRLGAHQLAITFGAVMFSAVAASRMILSMSKWTKDINIAPMSLEWEWTVAFFGSFIGDNYGLYTYQNSVTMSTRPSTLEHPDYVGNSGSTSLNKMLSKASLIKAVAGRHGGPSTSVDGKRAASFILPQGKVPCTLDHWDDVHDTCLRWNNEVPLGSVVAVLYSPGQYKTKLGTDSVSLNLMAVCILLKED